MKKILLGLLLSTLLVTADQAKGLDFYDFPPCNIVYDSSKNFASIVHHYIKVNGKKYTVIDNGGKETKTTISNKIKQTQCRIILAFNSTRDDWATKK